MATRVMRGDVRVSDADGKCYVVMDFSGPSAYRMVVLGRSSRRRPHVVREVMSLPLPEVQSWGRVGRMLAPSSADSNVWVSSWGLMPTTPPVK